MNSGRKRFNRSAAPGRDRQTGSENSGYNSESRSNNNDSTSFQSSRNNDDRGYKSDRPYNRDNRNDGERRSFGDRDNSRSFGDRKPFGDRDNSRSFGDRDNTRSYGDRDNRSYGDRGSNYGDSGRSRDNGGDSRDKFSTYQKGFNSWKGGYKGKGTNPRKEERAFIKRAENFNRFDARYDAKGKDKIDQEPLETTDFIIPFDRNTGDPNPSRFKRSDKNLMRFSMQGAPPNEVSFKPEDNWPIRLNRFLANSGIASRRDCDQFIQEGKVAVNGEVVTEMGVKVNKEDLVTYDGKPVKREKLYYVLLNKPKDFITTTEDPEGRKTVMDLVKKASPERLFPVGRLDRATTGLLLLTNDGDLAQKLMHPSFEVEKVYHIILDKPLTKNHLVAISEGVELEDGNVQVDEIAYVKPEDKREIGVEIHSGKNRVVRRIFQTFGYEVEKLDRVVYAGLTKLDLPRGHWRYLKPDEVMRLKRSKRL